MRACVSACMHVCVSVCVYVPCTLLFCETPGGKHCLMRDRDRGQLGRDRRARSTKRSGAPPLLQRVYLTLRVLSSLDQESVEGKEGRDEEEVTSALLPIWKGKKKHTRENTNKQNPYHLPWLQPIFPSKRILKSYSLCEISADISVTGGLTATLADDRCPEMFNPLEKCLP